MKSAFKFPVKQIIREKVYDDVRGYTCALYTQEGIVSATVYNKPQVKPCTVLSMVVDGYEYVHKYDKAYKPRYLVTLARRLSDAVTLSLVPMVKK